MRLFLAAVAAFCSLGTCLSPAYIQDPHNVPLFKKQGEVRASLSMDDKDGYSGQAAVAVAPRFAVVAGGTYANADNCLSCRIDVRRHGELGVGYFQDIMGISFEAYGGAGMGHTRSQSLGWGEFDGPLVLFDGRYRELFLQGDFGKAGKIFDRALSLRLVAMHFDAYTDTHYDDVAETETVLRGHDFSVFLDPAVTFGFGYKYLKGFAQFGFSLPLSSDLRYQYAWLSLGINVNTFGG